MLNLLIRIICEIGKWADGDESMEVVEQEFWERMQRKYGDVYEDLDEEWDE